MAEEADVVRLCLPAEGFVRAGSVAGAVPFGVKLYADFYAVFSLWERDAFPVLLT